MTARTFQLGLLLLGMPVVAQETAPPARVVEPPAPMNLNTSERVISRTRQFRITGGTMDDRASVALLAEEAKADLLALTEEKDAWSDGGVAVEVRLHGRPGDPLPARTEATQIVFSELGYKVLLDVHLGRGLEPERVRWVATSAVLFARTLEDFPKNSETPFLVPPWLVDGLREATAWRQGRSDRRLYEALFRSGGLFKIEDLFALTPAGFAEMDAAMHAAFRVSSGALVMALLEQPQGKDGFRSFLTEVAGFQGEMPALLRKHFPELNLSGDSLAKWWLLQMANIGGQSLTTDVMTVPETEAALRDALQFDFRTAEGVLERRDLNAWAEIAAQPAAARAKAVKVAQDALVRLSYRSFPSYRPLLAEYQAILTRLEREPAADATPQLEALAQRRAVMVAKSAQARDYLDWFEITRARETSGEFEDYMRLKDRLKERPHHRNDPLTKYLDRMDALFSRGLVEDGPAEPPMEMGDLPPLEPLPR